MYRLLLLLLPALHVAAQSRGGGGYYGRYIGPLSRLLHSVSGEVYAVDARTLHIRDFTYDGEGPAAYFYAGNSKSVGPGGFYVRDETGSNGVLKRYNKKHITLTLPEGKTLNNIRWVSIWCEEFAVNFGDVQIPRGLDFPKPQKIAALSGVHGVSSDNIVIVDAQTLLIPSFSYDGEAPDAKFWVGRGSKPNPQGIRVPDENGKQTPLRRYDRKTIVLTLPGELTVFDLGHFGVWCEAFTVDFGHVQVPASLNVPPSLKMLGVSPQKRSAATALQTTSTREGKSESKLNCEVLSDELAYEVRWAVAGDSIVIQLVAKLEDGEYMSFGLSGETDHSAMVGGDVVVAWVDQSSLNGYAIDYYLDAKSQCAGTHGSCPDSKLEANADSVRLLNAALVNGYSIVTYQRPLKAHDGLDRPILTNKSQPVIWAVGPLNSKIEVSYHSITSKGDVFIDFGRPPRWNCPIPQSADSAAAADGSPQASTGTGTGDYTHRHQEESAPVTQRNHNHNHNHNNKNKAEGGSSHHRTSPPTPAPAPTSGAWDIPPIQCNEPEDGVFYAQMGPTGGKRGYPAITGHVGWGISYYINGLLIPEIHVVRGRTYTFVVEGGKDSNVPAKFHPFYITDDPVGGYQYKTPEERRKVNIYAGAELTKKGEVVPTGLGRLCNWTPDPEQPIADEFASFGAYQRTLSLVCDHGEPAVVQWTPDRDTPNTVYYQCFTHRYLGWKIVVHDRCDLPVGAGSELVASVAAPDEELQARPSIQVTTRVKPEFPPQSLNNPADFKSKHSNKNQFPYEFMKPAFELPKQNASEFGNSNENDNRQVIPVKEDIEDIPESSTHKIVVQQVRGNVSMEVGGHHIHPGHSHNINMNMNMPVQHGVRVPYDNLRPPPTSRPVVLIRRPVQMKPVPMNHMIQHSGNQPRPVIVKKPVIRLPQRPMPPRPAMISAPRPPQKQVYVQKFKKPPTPAPGYTEKSKTKVHSSQMIGQSAEELTTKLPIAINTGFNPGSLVIESGFKPIISTPQVAEERVSEIDYDEEYNEETINADGSVNQKSQTEMFEPMFIPSPLDSNTKHTKKATTEPLKKRKPVRQVVIRRPVYEEPLFRSEPDPEEDEVAMADEKVESYSVPDHSVLTYDGKHVDSGVAPPVPSTGKSKTKGSEQLQHSPQFGPFKGDVPPPVPKKVPANIPQLKLHGGAVPLPLRPDDKKEKIEVVTPVTEKESEKSARSKKMKRSANHDGHDHSEQDHDHSEHDHSHETHPPTQQQKNNATKMSPVFLTIVCLFFVKSLHSFN